MLQFATDRPPPPNPEPPRLEIVHHGPRRGPARRTRLLFVHGISVGAWVWAERFMPFLAERGFESFALSLRGHGNSAGRETITENRFADYAQDLSEAIEEIGGPLVLIGHSLGGALVQNAVREGRSVRAMALLGSIPPWGLAPSALRMGVRHPDLLREVLALSMTDGRFKDAAVMRRNLFSPDLPDEDFERYLAGSGPESTRIGGELQGWPPFAPLPFMAPPSFVLGGWDDHFIPPGEVFRTGLYYGTAPVLVPHLPHAMMFDPRWRDAAEPLAEWLENLPEA